MPISNDTLLNYQDLFLPLRLASLIGETWQPWRREAGERHKSIGGLWHRVRNGEWVDYSLITLDYPSSFGRRRREMKWSILQRKWFTRRLTDGFNDMRNRVQLFPYTPRLCVWNNTIRREKKIRLIWWIFCTVLSRFHWPLYWIAFGIIYIFQ